MFLHQYVDVLFQAKTQMARAKNERIVSETFYNALKVSIICFYTLPHNIGIMFSAQVSVWPSTNLSFHLSALGFHSLT